MITAKVIQDSLSRAGVRITTMELEYPRFIHGEFMTHRVFSRNAASSRAIPVAKMLELVLESAAQPVVWGLNQAGMQASKVHSDPTACEMAWHMAAKSAAKSAVKLHELGLHKQIANRVLEPFQTMKTVVTATEWDNFFTLRDHSDAQPEMQVLAREMILAMESSTPLQLDNGEWHVPYVDRKRETDGTLVYWAGQFCLGSASKEALMVSSSCCAQVSYRVLDTSLNKAMFVYDKLINSTPIHASPFEHQGMSTEMVRTSEFSGNLRGFKQYRKTLEG
jgi:hypothetical protein